MAGTRQPSELPKPAKQTKPAANDEHTPQLNMRLNLRLVAVVDFRYGILHHYEDLRKRRLMRDLDDDECALLVSQTGKRIAFVFSEVKLERGRYEPTRAIASLELRLDKTTPWHPAMLSVYAERVGIELLGDGIKRFEDALAKYADEKDKAA